MNKCLFASSASILLAFGAGCSSPHAAPEALITVLDANAQAPASSASCTALSAPVDGLIGSAAPITGSCSHTGAVSGSADTAEQPLSYQWTLVDAPSASVSKLDHTDLVTPSFVPDAPGDYRLRLVVSDGMLTSDPAEALVRVGLCGDRVPVAAPTASALSPATGAQVQLDVNVSDADTLPDCAAHAAVYTYDWSFVELPMGSSATLNDTKVHDPSFKADVPGTYRVRVIATDPTAKSSQAQELAIQAADCGNHAPVISGIDATPSAAPASGQVVSLTPSFSDADVESDCQAHAPVFTYAWQFDGVPSGSQAKLNQLDTLSPSFTPDVPGDYRLRVTITDPTGRSATQSTTITASACGTNAPVATAIANPSSASPGAAIQLQASASDADTAAACGLSQSFAYNWRWVEVPAGSGAMLANPHAQMTGFKPDQPGSYIAELVVTDESGRASAPVRATVTVDSCGTAAPIAVASKVGPGSTVDCGASAIPVDLAGSNQLMVDAVNSSDPDNGACGLSQTLFYSWTLLSTPMSGGSSRVRNPTGRSTVIDASANGDYQVRLLVTDSTGLVSNEAICLFTVSNAG